jgi:predicted phage-related endonuclease
VSYTIVDCEQRSDEWKLARAGRLTGSAAADMMRKARKAGDESAARRDLRFRLALERITGRPQENEFTTASVRNGVEKEPDALALYEAESGLILERVGFLSLGTVMAGCSLDGFVGGREGIVEAKCPKSATHYEYLMTREIPADYRWQCVHNLWISGARWCDFISYDDCFPPELQYLCLRLERNEIEIRDYAAAAGRFLAEVSVAVADINKLKAAA